VQKGGDKNRRNFPNPEFGRFSKPLTVVDSKGRIVLWYLPGLVTDDAEAGFFFVLVEVASDSSTIG
jgi:hypothetical protein